MDEVKVESVKINLKNNCKSAGKYLLTFLKWLALAAVTGAVGGVIGALFHLSVEYVTGVRKAHSWIVLLLPVGGLVIAGLYKLSGKKDIGTNEILDAVRSPQGVPALLAPLIFVSTVITHLFGGSAGREGAALQLGGSIAGLIGKIARLDEKDMHIMTMCGMSAVFSALFGAPITAAVFALGVISVGVIYYAGLLPCVVSAFVAYFISTLMGTEPVVFTVSNIPAFSLKSCLLTALLAAICALLSIGFCLGLRGTHKLFAKLFKNTFIRAVVGGLIIVALSLICRSGDYNGAGMDIVERAIGGNAKPEAFLLKFIFTAVTVSSGYKGGEIVPTFFVGATFGCVVGGLIGLDPGFAAAVGLVSLFCGVVNCPLASIFLSIELFGAQGMPLFALAAAVSYLLSGYYGLYSSQKIVYSKLRAELVNINAK
ncbi:MAG: chloride channel protein [Oscillospiraceae bacterium]|nr:chloride channel protein [Oscillospiraceae bacterium]